MGEAAKSYDYPTGNIEMVIRLQGGEPLEAVMADIGTKWRPGNEHLWDEYDPETLIDTDEKRSFMVNQLIYSRIRVFRELKAKGIDTRGSDPFDHVDQAPELMRRLRAQFPDTTGRIVGGSPA